MTHKDIYTKFMIEYDKANVTSSYPSLTEYEVATVLDKAYNALIAQKVTGNNVRRIALEGDLKSVVDLQPLVCKKTYVGNAITAYFTSNIDSDMDNTMSVTIPSDFLYYIGCDIKKLFNTHISGDTHYSTGSYAGPIDQLNSGAPVRSRRIHVKLVSHQIAEGFKASASNIPWIKNPVCYIENDTLYIVVDSYDKPKTDFCELTYIKTPNKFAKDLSNLGDFLEDDDAAGQIKTISYFDWEVKRPDEAGYNSSYARDAHEDLERLYEFECNDTVAEELISLAVAFALENVESQRLNSKLNMRGLEA